MLSFKGNEYINRQGMEKPNDIKKRQQASTKEGVVVNSFIKNNELACDTINLPQSTEMPDELYSKKKKISDTLSGNPVLPLIITPLIVLGGGAMAMKIFKRSTAAKSAAGKYGLPGIGRMITINDDNNMVLYLLTQDPSRKSLLAAAGVITVSAGAFIMKNVVDGFKEIWVQKQKADIKRDLEENLIETETRSFAGKNQILRTVLAQSSEEIKEISENSMNNSTKKEISDDSPLKENASFKRKQTISFKGESNEEKSSDKNWLLLTAGVITLGISAFFVKSIFKDLSKIANTFEKNSCEVKKKINELPEIHEEGNLNAKLDEWGVQDEEERAEFYRKWEQAQGKDIIFDTAPEQTWGKRNKISFNSAVGDITAFLYTYIVNPTKQTRNLLLLVFGHAIAAYLGKTAVEGVKEVQVEKHNAETEYNLQDRLVQVELKNFLAKKESFTKPIIADFKEEASKTQDPQRLKQLAENALFEIKTGPPFVYS